VTRIACLARLDVGALFSLQLVAPQFVAAQAYPTKSIRLIGLKEVND
jgi:hypothetical protein